eukprot:GHVQ01006900.1.p1 GENE.GHVQ01006900.1~~GHVQ01006900.1.p1  ORF type:complete len:312 (+),score=87.49 GHVQ01006900.1:47-982(+)
MLREVAEMNCEVSRRRMVCQEIRRMMEWWSDMSYKEMCVIPDKTDRQTESPPVCYDNKYISWETKGQWVDEHVGGMGEVGGSEEWTAEWKEECVNEACPVGRDTESDAMVINRRDVCKTDECVGVKERYDEVGVSEEKKGQQGETGKEHRMKDGDVQQRQRRGGEGGQEHVTSRDDCVHDNTLSVYIDNTTATSGSTRTGQRISQTSHERETENTESSDRDSVNENVNGERVDEANGEEISRSDGEEGGIEGKRRTSCVVGVDSGESRTSGGGGWALWGDAHSDGRTESLKVINNGHDDPFEAPLNDPFSC